MVAGLSCGACVARVERRLAAEPDVLAARVNLSTRRLRVQWRGGPSRANELAELVARLGFQVAPWSQACLAASDDEEGRGLIRALGVAAFGAVNVMILSIAVWVGTDMGEATRATLHWLTALVALPVVAYAGQPFFRNALAGIRGRRLNMDVAVSLALVATCAMSLSETFRNGPFTWFDGATSLVALLLAGRVLERAARRRARQAVAELLALQSGEATVMSGDGQARSLPVENVRAGDILLVAAGERLKLDAVLTGPEEAVLDLSATTGESVPRRVLAGAAMPAGAVNTGDPIRARVTAAAADGSLAAVARLLERGEATRARFTGIADRAVRFYLPAVHAVAAATFLGWWLWVGLAWQEALVPAVAALIVTCPCGFAIAVPAVQAVSVGALFRNGVLVANGTALERLAAADRVVFDKTGTLTEGRPTLLAGDWTEPDLRGAAAVARVSRHPMARALAAAAPEGGVVEGVSEAPGRGLLRHGEPVLGNAAFLGVKRRDTGLTLWFRSAPGAAAVAFRFADQLRPEAEGVVRDLEGLGLRAEVLSGDAEPAVADAAQAAGIRAWRAAVSPGDKAAHVEALRSEGMRPLVVGDGINDAGALSAAHVSACPEAGTDLAQGAADLVLRGVSPLRSLPLAIRVARHAQVLARQNIAVSLLYNTVAVPLAVSGMVTPPVAALAMAASSLTVIANALRAERTVTMG